MQCLSSNATVHVIIRTRVARPLMCRDVFLVHKVFRLPRIPMTTLYGMEVWTLKPLETAALASHAAD